MFSKVCCRLDGSDGACDAPFLRKFARETRGADGVEPRSFISFLPGAACQVDVQELEKALAAGRGTSAEMERLRSAVALYRGPFLDGFTLDDSPAFEEWVLNRREHHSQQMLLALSLLADGYEEVGEYTQAEAYARRQLGIEPWREAAHCQLMRLLALRIGNKLDVTKLASIIGSLVPL